MVRALNAQIDTSRERLELAAEAIGIGFWEWDLVADRLCADRALARRFGIGLRGDCTPSEEFEHLLHPADLADFREALARARETTDRVSHRCRMRCLDGPVRHVEVHLQVSRDRLGCPHRMLGMVRDVTAETEAAERLAATMRSERELLERLSVAIQAAGLSCWEFSYEHRRFTWMDSLPGFDVQGLTIEQMNERVFGALAPEDAENIRRETQQALASGAETLSSRVRLTSADGRVVYGQVYQKFFRDEHGRPVRSLGATRDVTDEVHAAELLRMQKEELELSQRRIERASLSVQEGHWEVDLVTRRYWVSSNFHALLGYGPKEPTLDSVEAFRDRIHPEDLPRALKAERDHLFDNVPYDVELRIRCKDGVYRWFRMRGCAERDEGGTAVRLSGSIEEIERQKAAEDALREAQARFERAIEGTQDGLWEVDMQLGKIWMSPRLHHLLGYEVGELGDHVYAMRNLIHPDDVGYADNEISRQAEHGQPVEFEVRMRTKSGNYRWYRLRGSPSSLPGEPVTRVSGSMQDVTEAREAKDALVRASEAAKAASEAKSAFLANMSHEIRTPMNGIIGMATLLLDTRLDPMQRELAETIQTSSQSLLTVINDILDFSKIEAGKLAIESLEMDVRGLIDDALSTLRFQAQEKALRLTVNVKPEVPERTLGDPQRIRQCLLNLLSNAIKFTHEGEVSLEVSTRGQREGRMLVRFDVHDTGIGIAPESLKTLFQPFVQADTSTTRHFGGTGLGLSIVRGLVEMMGGEVGATSEPGKGSTFWFQLPMAEVCAEQRRPEPPAARSTWGNRRYSGRVLLVEDNLVNQKVAQRFLERLGCEVVLAQNGEEGCRAWEREAFDLVLMDIQMPVMDGYTATARIRERERDGRRTPVIALTANAMSGQLERCLEAGMDGLLTKPIVLEKLCEALDRAGLASAPVRADTLSDTLPPPAVEAMVKTPTAPATPAVEISQLAELAGEDGEFVHSVVQSFEKSMSQLLSTMRAAAAAGDLTQVARAAHQVKGAAANLQAGPSSTLAAEIETQARAQRREGLTASIDRLDDEIGRATAALQSFAARMSRRASA